MSEWTPEELANLRASRLRRTRCARREAHQKRPCRMIPATIIKQAAPSRSSYSGQTERRVIRRTR